MSVAMKYPASYGYRNPFPLSPIFSRGVTLDRKIHCVGDDLDQFDVGGSHVHRKGFNNDMLTRRV